MQFIFSGCVKANCHEFSGDRDPSEWRFLTSNIATAATSLMNHVSRILNAFCCILEDVTPGSGSAKAPLVTLPSASALSPIRRKLKSAEGGNVQEKEEKHEELGRKWTKPSQLLSPSNLGYFGSLPLYMKLHDLLKGTYATCKVYLCFVLFLQYR